jgi:hypothetical protein
MLLVTSHSPEICTSFSEGQCQTGRMFLKFGEYDSSYKEEKLLSYEIMF